MTKTAHSFIAIPRHALYDERRYHGEFPALLFHEEDEPHYTHKKSPVPVPIEYFIIPVTTRESWEGLSVLHELTEVNSMERMQEQMAAERGGPEVLLYPEKGRQSFTTISMPQLRPSAKNDYIAMLQVNNAAYQYYKKKFDVIEVPDYSTLLQKYWELLPEEPPSATLSQPLQKMLSRVPDGPLQGIFVVAFDQQIAGSLAAEELARSGATVIKIEKKEGGDPKRGNSSKTAFNTFNAGKFSVAFDDTPEDQELKKKLLRMADVIIDNRSEKAQLRDDVLQKTLLVADRKKPLIYCAISGFGRGTQIPAYDRVVQAAAGMADLNGKLVSFPLIDMATGKEAAREIINYLFYRERMPARISKETPCIRLDISMAATALSMMSNTIATHLDTGQTYSTIVPFDLYQTKDGKLSVGVATDAQFQTLCNVLHLDELKEFHTNEQRKAHREIIERKLHETFATRTVSEWVALLSKNNLSASAVVSMAEAIKSHGHDIIKPTLEGELLIAGPTHSNIFPHNPIIGSAPQHNGDKSVVAELIHHLQQEAHDPQALHHALEVASNEPSKNFQRQYKYIDVHALDFSKHSSELPWAKGRFFYAKKIGSIQAKPAKAHEVVKIVHNNVFSSSIVAMEGDWKITTSFGDTYLLSDKKFKKNYIPGNKKGEYIANPELKPRKAIVVTQDVRFTSSSNDITYIPKGGWIALGNNGPYGIHPNNIKGNYHTAWTKKESQARQERSEMAEKGPSARAKHHRS